MRCKGFTLTEVLMAIFILGIGVLGIAALFPAGIAQQRASVDDVIGPLVADNAIALLRARLEPGDFGTFEEFIDPSVPGHVADLPLRTVPGDWPWLRPGFLLEDDSTTQTFAGDPYDERGALDIFSYRLTRAQKGLPLQGGNIPLATELPDGVPDEYVLADRLYGIPYNPSRYDFTDPSREPRVIVTQQERYYPIASEEVAGSDRVLPLYLWDCMFRRFQGRVYVAIFVYRVSSLGGGRSSYVTPPNPLWTDAPNPVDVNLPPLPYRLDLTEGNLPPWPRAWDAWGINATDPTDDAFVVGTAAGDAWDLRDPEWAWQQHGQWLLDQNNTVHRVLSRTPERGGNAAAIELLRPIQPVTWSDQAVSFIDRYSSDVGVENIVTHLWYIPAEVELDVDGDGDADPGNSVSLTSVYVTVREL
ncbi:MAG: prepilin-type N-terminal cleavage/methylation domain-containing protein [Planctomycetota bacterium]